uniref:Aldo/keto reductase n=1 Tax=uncultured bacterium BAC-AB1442/1414/561 TaxID=1562172 RepID=A0A0C4S6G1_9BACT|nr:aldo/keto reductase [uncultured bacterium BAC-AB1442/1414/561]
MGMSGGYGVPDERLCLETVDRALAAGITLIDTADFYGGGDGEKLLGRAVAGRRDQLTLLVKTGIRPDPAGGMMLDGRPEHLRQAVDGSLQRLGTDHLDIYCLAWRDPAVPIEESVGAMSELVKAGKVRHLALSEVSVRTLRAAMAVHPLVAVTTEYSLVQRHVEAEILTELRASGCGLLAYAPLSRGLLTGTVARLADLDEGDWRNNFPRFADGNIERNLALLEPVREVAGRTGLTLSQLALAWVLHRGPDIVPLVGAKHPDNIAEDAEAASVTLSPDDLAILDRCFPPAEVAGHRYAPVVAGLIDA